MCEEAGFGGKRPAKAYLPIIASLGGVFAGWGERLGWVARFRVFAKRVRSASGSGRRRQAQFHARFVLGVEEGGEVGFSYRLLVAGLHVLEAVAAVGEFVVADQQGMLRVGFVG